MHHRCIEAPKSIEELQLVEPKELYEVMTRKDKNFGLNPLHLLAKLDHFNTLFLTLEKFSPYDRIQGKHVSDLITLQPSYLEIIRRKLFLITFWKDPTIRAAVN